MPAAAATFAISVKGGGGVGGRAGGSEDAIERAIDWVCEGLELDETRGIADLAGGRTEPQRRVRSVVFARWTDAARNGCDTRDEASRLAMLAVRRSSTGRGGPHRAPARYSGLSCGFMRGG